MVTIKTFLRRDGGTGRRTGLKILRWQHHVGSIPSPGKKNENPKRRVFINFPDKRLHFSEQKLKRHETEVEPPVFFGEPEPPGKKTHFMTLILKLPPGFEPGTADSKIGALPTELWGLFDERTNERTYTLQKLNIFVKPNQTLNTKTCKKIPFQIN